MSEIILDNIYLALLLPLWIFLIIMLGRFVSVYVNKNIIYALTLLTSAFGAVLCGLGLYNIPADKILEYQIPFVKINNFIINCGLHVDKLSLIFAFVLFIISFFVQMFSISYMKDEKKTYRFYALLNLFNFSMAGFFFSPNLFQSYMFWEVIGVASYLLIGFEYFKQDKSIASKKVFIINRIGDTALISAIILCSYFMYTYSNNMGLTTLSFVDMNVISTLVYAYTSTPLFIIICSLFIIAGAVKSAQAPFYTWLQDAMEAKLPVSSLLHSATLAAVGVFLIIRLLPMITLEEVLLKTISAIGLLTAIICSFSACANNHPKKVLAYSTSAQMGLVFLAIGTMNLKACIAFFIAHAFIKSMMFLTLPNQKSETCEEFSFSNFILFLLGGLSLSGLMFSGMVAKEMIYTNLSAPLNIIFCVISFLTAFYIIRIALIIGLNKNKPIIKSQFVSELALMLLNIGFYLYLRKHFSYTIAEPFWSALTAWVVVYILYVKNAFWKVPVLYNWCLNGFYLDKFYSKTIPDLYKKFSNILDKIDTKIFSNYLVPITVAKFGVLVSDKIETYIMNGSVRFVTSFSKWVSACDKKAQNGNIQRYNAYAFIIITVILTCLIIGYTSLMIRELYG